MINRLSTKQVLSGALILISLLLSLWHFGPLQHTLPALLLAVGIQVYLTGYLAARALGLLRYPDNIIIRIVWIVTCGLGITIVVGAISRLLLVPLPVYLTGLHLLMGVLVLVPSKVRPPKLPTAQTAPYYVFLGIICLLFIIIGWERNHMRFSGFPDQTYPVSLADWWINNPQPQNVVGRNAAAFGDLTYWSSDGLTYVYAAWGWASGASAVQIIWYVVTPLFVWLVPLAHFAAAYRLTKRMDTAAWAAGFVFIFALTTINSPSLLGGAWMYGQEAAFHLTTLRYFSTALMLPLVVFVFVHTWRMPHFRNLLMLGILILALALIHPRQFLVMLTGFYAVLGLHFIVKPSKRRLRRVVILGLALLPALIVPLWQYSFHLQNQITPDLISELGDVASIKQQVIEPAMLLFHPFVILTLLISLAAILRLRRSRTAQYLVATAAVMLILSYITPIFNIILRVLGSYFGIHFIFELFFIMPIGIALGSALSAAHDGLAKRLRLHILTTDSFIAGGFVVMALVTLIEPLPIPMSARDQIDALNQMQAIRDIRPFEEQLIARLAALPVKGDKTVFVTDNRIDNFIIESVPFAFGTGGRAESNPAYAGTVRFFDSQHTPWLDAEDIAFLQQYAVDYIVVSADSTRLPQLVLEPQRFEPVDSTAGYVIFGVRKPLATSPLDTLFSQMNTLYSPAKNPAWFKDDFQWPDVPNPVWQASIDGWQKAAAAQPDNALARYGWAYSQLMAGDMPIDRLSALSAAHPDLILFTETAARVLAQRGDTRTGFDHLWAAFEQSQHEQRVMAARALLTEPFFALLTSDQLDTVLAASAADAHTWANLMEWSHEDDLRMRTALLMSAGRWETAAAWLARIPEVKRVPRDLIAQAAVQLLDGSLDTARATLHQSIDLDWLQPHMALYHTAWTDDVNDAARAYFTLTDASDGDISPALITQTRSLFVMQPEVKQQGNQMLISATFGSFTPALPPQFVSIQIASADGTTTYQTKSVPVDIPAGQLQHLTITLDLIPSVPAQTPVRVRIQLQHSPALIYQTVEVEAVRQ